MIAFLIHFENYAETSWIRSRVDNDPCMEEFHLLESDSGTYVLALDILESEFSCVAYSMFNLIVR